MSPIVFLALIPAVPLAAMILGVLAAWAIGQPAQFWRTSLPLFLLFGSVLVGIISWPPLWAFDLAGGTLLVYDVEARDLEPGIEKSDLVALEVSALRRRVDPDGLNRIDIRANHDGQIEIRVPAGEEDAVVKQVQQVVRGQGFLEFRIVANKDRHERLCALAERPSGFDEKTVRDESGRVLGRWVRAEESPEGETSGRFSPDELIEMVTRRGENSKAEVLTVEDRFLVNGSRIAGVSGGIDVQGNPCIHFWMTAKGAALFAALTGANMPDEHTSYRARLGIILDGELLSAPYIMSRITDRGQITGRFTREEVDFIVGILKAGRLPANLNPEPLEVSHFAAEEPMSWTRWCLIGTPAVMLVLTFLVMVVSGRRGVAAAAAAWLAAVLLVSGTLASSLTLTFPTVITACVLVLVMAIGSMVLARRGRLESNAKIPLGVASTSRLRPRIWIAFCVLGLALVAGGVIFAVGMGEVRRGGLIVTLASLAAMASVACCLWPLLGLFSPPPRSGDGETSVITADLAD